MGKLVILDYVSHSVDIYDVDSNANVDDVYIEELGYESSMCHWMVAPNGLNITFYDNQTLCL